ncbi:heparinase II/III family protein [Bacteroidota bacterium]
MNQAMNDYRLRVMLTVMFFLFLSSCGGGGQDGKISVPGHPRIILTVGSEEILKETISENRVLNELNTLIISTANEMIGLAPRERNVVGRRLLGVSRTYLKRVLWLSYSYRMTRDEKYLIQSEKEMLAAASFSDWNPSHFLDVAEMTAALAIGYDWLYDDLPENSKKTIREAIIQKGLLPSKIDEYSQRWLNDVNNWNQVCNAGMVLGALAVYEDQPALAQEIIIRAVQSIRLPQEAYEPDGAYREGPGYWNYGTTFNILLISALQGNPGIADDLYIGVGFMKSAGYHQHVTGDQGFFNYFDNPQDISLFPAHFWYSSVLNDPNLMWSQNDLVEDLLNGTSEFEAEGSDDRLFPMAMIWAGELKEFEFTPPGETSWLGNGRNPVGIHRSSWEKNSIFFGIKGGTVSTVSHSHMDMGSFVMDADGVRWAIDLGGHPYHALESQGMSIWGRAQDAERWTIFRYTNRAHNTLTVNDQLINVDGYAPIVKHSGEEDFKYTVVDLSQVYAGKLDSVVRGMAMVENSYVMVRDEIINAGEPANLRWAMVTHDNIEITGQGTALIRKEGKQLQFKIMSPALSKIKTYTTDPQNDYENKNPGTKMIGLEVDLEPDEAVEIVILLIPGSVEAETSNTKSMGKLEDW